MSLTVRIFLALVLGLGGGIALAALASPQIVAGIAAVAEPAGGIWLDALQMTIIPLVFGLLFTGIASAAGEASASRTAGARAAVVRRDRRRGRRDERRRHAAAA